MGALVQLELVGLKLSAVNSFESRWLPTVASGDGALSEYVQYEANGLLFSSGSAAALRAAFLRIVQEPRHHF